MHGHPEIADIRRILIDDAYLIFGFQPVNLAQARTQVVRVLVGEGDVARTILNELIAAEKDQPFVLPGGILIPHVPTDSMCSVAWFRSVEGVPSGHASQEMAYIIFCAFAPDHILRDIMGYACEILRHDTFPDTFGSAKTGSTLRQIISSHLRMHFDRRASENDHWKEMWPSHLWPHAHVESDDILVAHALISHRRGLDARFAAHFVKIAAGFDCEVVVSAKGVTVSGRSILGLMMLAVGPGKFVEVAAVGRDAKEAIEILPRFLEGREFSKFYD